MRPSCAAYRANPKIHANPMLTTTTQISKILGIKRVGVHRRVKRLGIVPVVIGQTHVFTPDQVEKICAVPRRGSPAPKIDRLKDPAFAHRFNPANG